MPAHRRALSPTAAAICASDKDDVFDASSAPAGASVDLAEQPLLEVELSGTASITRSTRRTPPPARRSRSAARAASRASAASLLQLDALAEVGFTTLAPPGGGGPGGHVVQAHVVPGQRGDVGDPVAHGAGADHGDAVDAVDGEARRAHGATFDRGRA
jgi:hypothetical protein